LYSSGICSFGFRVLQWLVYLAEPNDRYDLSALEAYGPIVYASKEKLNPFTENRSNLTESASKENQTETLPKRWVDFILKIVN